MEESAKVSYRRQGINLPAYVVVSIGLTLLVMAASINYILSGFGYVVLVDGQEVAVVYEKDLIEKEMQQLEAAAGEAYGMEMLPDQEVVFENQFRPGEMVPQQLAWDMLSNRLSFSTSGVVVVVNGIDTVVVPSMEAYHQVLEGLKLAYASSDQAIIREVQIEEKLEGQTRAVKPEELRSVQDALAILLRGTDRIETYVVNRGDTLWGIAENSGMTVEQLVEANPGSTEIIHPGDELNLIVPEPIVNITTTEEITVKEAIPYKTSYVTDSSMWSIQTKVVTPGKNGTREVTYLITKENGAEIKREEIDSEVLSEPVTQVIARGTAQMPSLGSGRFMWPLPPGGRITSGYGWRWGKFHKAIDIAHSRGTPVYASDSGVAKTDYGSSYGYYVTIYHGNNGYSTRYAHLSGFNVSTGQQVSKGQVIGYVGNTGYSTGPHLHFEIRYNGEPINPLSKFNP